MLLQFARDEEGAATTERWSEQRTALTESAREEERAANTGRNETKNCAIGVCKI